MLAFARSQGLFGGDRGVRRVLIPKKVPGWRPGGRVVTQLWAFALAGENNVIVVVGVESISFSSLSDGVGPSNWLARR